MKKRSSKGVGPVRGRAREAATDAAAISVHPLDSSAVAALDALTTTYESLAAALPAAPPMDVPLDLVAERMTGGAALSRQCRALARLLLLRAVSDARPSDARLDVARDPVEVETPALAAPEHRARRRASATADAALAATAELLREVGLEEMDLSVHLARDSGGVPVIVSHPVPPETAHTWLLGRLYDRAELLVATDPLLALERGASWWWFERWSGATRRPSEEERFSHRVREQEWSFVERETVALGAPVMATLSETPFFQDIPPRQRRMARALGGSFSSLFAVRETGQDNAVLEDLVDGGRHEIHEHNVPVMYRPGFLALGRLIPFEGARPLRSPGMLFLEAREPKAGEILARGVRAASDDVARAVLIESVIATLVSGTRVPRALKPASSPREARRLLQALSDAMATAGRRARALPDDLPAEVRSAAARTNAPVYTYPVDEALNAWVTALTEQSGRAAFEARGRPKGRSSRRKHR